MIVPALRAVLVLAAALLALPSLANAADDRPRLIVITDIGTEPDDIESMVRLLTYANEIEIEGLIAATSRHMSERVRPELIEERVQAYGTVLANLRVHDPRYPDAAVLQSRIRAWHPELGMVGVGKGKSNAASQLIIDAVDKSDTRPVWVSVWGGAAPLAQALWTVRNTRKEADVARFVAKLRVYSISDQDDAGPWARANFPHLFWVASIHGPGQYGLATWTGVSARIEGADNDVVSKRWLRRNIQSAGPLGALYPTPMFIMEGDTPSFLNLIQNGLSVPDRPDWGGWGGRWEQPSPEFGLWADTTDTVTGADGKSHNTNKSTVWRWRKAFQNDFAARLRWSVTPKYADANHAPRLVLNGAAGTAPVRISVCPGGTTVLSSAGSVDPDGQPISIKWWQYREPSGFLPPDMKIATPDAGETAISVAQWEQPADFPLSPVVSLHILLEAADNGALPLVAYRRAIIDIPTDGRTVDGKPCPKVAYRHQSYDPAAKPRTVLPGAWHSTVESEIGELLDNPATRAVIDRHLPGVSELADKFALVRSMTFDALRGIEPKVTDAVLDRMDAELAGIPPPPDAAMKQ